MLTPDTPSARHLCPGTAPCMARLRHGCATAMQLHTRTAVAEQPLQQKGIEKKKKQALVGSGYKSWYIFLSRASSAECSIFFPRALVAAHFGSEVVSSHSHAPNPYPPLFFGRTLFGGVVACFVVWFLSGCVCVCVRACVRVCLSMCRANQPPNERFNLQSEHRVITSHHITAPKHQPNRTQPNPTARNATSNPEAATEPPTVERYFAPIHPSLDKLWNERTNELWNELWNEVNEANENVAAAAKSQHRYTGNFHRNLQNPQNLQNPSKTSENLRNPRNLRQ